MPAHIWRAMCIVAACAGPLFGQATVPRGTNAQEAAARGAGAHGSAELSALQRLQAQYEQQDKSPLVFGKEAGDSELQPVLLLQELGDARRLDWCSLLRFDYSDAPLKLERSGSPEDFSRLGAALAPYHLSEKRSAFFTLVERRYAYNGMKYPVISWMEGRVGMDDGSVYVDWYEPFVVNRDLDFPDYPGHLSLAWNKDKMELRRDGATNPNQVEFSDTQAPVFDSPPQFYTFFDSLRPRFVLANLPAPTNAAANALPAGTMQLKLAQAGGQSLRQTTLKLDKGALSRISIHQEQLSLHHQDHAQYLIHRVVPGKGPQTQEFHPTSRIDFLVGGRDIDIRFGEGGYPLSISMKQGNEPTFDAVVTKLTYGDSSDADFWKDRHATEIAEADARAKDVYAAIDHRAQNWTPSPYTQAQLDANLSGGLLRARLKYNLFSAVKTKDFALLDAALADYRQLLARDGIPNDIYCYNLECLAESAFEFVDADTGWTITDKYLRPAYAKSTTAELRSTSARLIDQGRWGFALVAASELSGKPDETKSAWPRSVQQRLFDAIAQQKSAPPNPADVTPVKFKLTNAAVAARLSADGALPNAGVTR